MSGKFVMIDFGTVRNRLEDHGGLSLELEARKRACRGRARTSHPPGPRDDEDAEIGMHSWISREVDPSGTASVVFQDIETERTDYVGHIITEFDLAPAVLRRGVRVRRARLCVCTFVRCFVSFSV